jgi:hypothetical protein
VIDFIFARVTPLELRRILRMFQFSILSIAIFLAIGLKLDQFYCFVLKSSSSCFDVIELFFARDISPLIFENF